MGQYGGNGKRQRWDDERIDERAVIDDGYDDGTNRNDGVGIRDAIARRRGKTGDETIDSKNEKTTRRKDEKRNETMTVCGDDEAGLIDE